MELKDAPEESLWENHSQGDAHGKRPQRDTLRTHKEYPFKDITEKIIS
jgi:hypothetical protein